MSKKRISIRKKLKDVKEVWEYKRNHGIKKDGDGNAVITVNIANEEDLFDKFSPEDDKRLNADIFSYVEERAYEIPLSEQLTINFTGSHIGEEDREIIKKSIKEHYLFKITDKNDDLHTNLIKCIVLGVFGTLVIGTYLLLSLLNKNPLFLEIISVIGSFAVWEATDYYLIERNSIKKEILDIFQLAEAEIKFD